MNKQAVQPNLIDNRFAALGNRKVGFELFNARLAKEVLREKDYVALCGRFVLIGFQDKTRAEAFFAEAMEITL